jgi:hypothetical protein
MRIKSKWHKKDKTKTPKELAGAVGFFGWRIAAHHVEAITAEAQSTQRFD